MADAMTGWFGLDIAQDDGYRFGRWPWQTDRKRVPIGAGIEGAAPAKTGPAAAPASAPATK